ncbi:MULTISPECIES: YaaA family protein [Actinomyces]|uniref:Peroxide stress protein YaaA n=1 Tax=Actinomyces respiraculi TaxID=2744574 RepID=A0A7T0LMK4_9ACTO|nr:MULTISPECIES: peroxide stress protein YaaA [Actinomyces]QPL06372.1 peroxide stress protein YaaA [Actinomyces respiraculi]
MLILLPPSEGKTSPVSGPTLDLASLLGAEALSDPRREVMSALARVSARSDASSLLGLGPRSAGDVALNLVLEQAACAPAHALFTGVLYDAAGMALLGADPATRRVLGGHVVIMSGVWGALRATDSVPDHRLSMATSLEGPGRLASFWRPWLTPVLEGLAGDGIVVDCRSGAYSPAWQPTPARTATLLRVSVVVERADGSRSAVSHHVKHTRGLLTGALVRALAAGTLSPDDDVEAVVRVAGGLEAVRGAELGLADRAGRRDLVLVLAGAAR